jgi:hypothetical protein
MILRSHLIWKDPGDIIGQTETNQLLKSTPTLSSATSSYGLQSKALLDQVLHNAELCHTDFAVDKIARRLPDICAEFVLRPRYGDS